LHTKKWVGFFFTFAMVIIVIVSGTNCIINPYNIFGHGLDQAFQQKPYTLSDRMSKFYLANRLKPKTIMMGTSRIGIFPESQLTPYLETPIYNLSLAGSTIDEQAAYIHYMVKYNHVKHIIWSLDFFSFNPTKPIDPTFEPKRLSKSIFLNDYYVALFNFTTLNRSFQTVIANRHAPIKTNPVLGQPFTKDQIQFNIRHTLIEYSGEKTFLNSEIFKEPSSIGSKIALLKQTIDYCRDHNVSCILYTSPIYHQHIDMIYGIGLGKTFEHWKKSLAYIQPYIDFCTYTPLSKDIMLFRDSSHVISDVGELIFARIFNPNTKSIPNDFGYLVTPLNVDEHLKIERAQVKPYPLTISEKKQ